MVLIVTQASANISISIEGVDLDVFVFLPMKLLMGLLFLKTRKPNQKFIIYRTILKNLKEKSNITMNV